MIINIAANLSKVLNQLEDQHVLVAISKKKSEEDIMEAYHAGHRDFGENKVQELLSKYESLPKDIRWHMVGHLQRNKVKLIVPFIHMIHGVDSLRLLNTINKEGKKIDRRINCLLQIHIADEETKFGLSDSEVMQVLTNIDSSEYTHIKICGLMGMATNTDNKDKIHHEFRSLKLLFDEIKSKDFNFLDNFSQLSMGMSNDYEIALEEGATILRLGTSIFGPRNK